MYLDTHNINRDRTMLENEACREDMIECHAFPNVSIPTAYSPIPMYTSVTDNNTKSDFLISSHTSRLSLSLSLSVFVMLQVGTCSYTGWR